MSRSDHRAQTDRIREKLERARRADPEFVVFGASTHRYLIGPPIAESDVAAFEESQGIRLPGCYRAFLTQVGNGGPAEDRSITRLAGRPPSQEEIEAFEKSLGISIGEHGLKVLGDLMRGQVTLRDYGAGPDHGLYPLAARDALPNRLREKPRIAPGMTFEEWAAIRDSLEARSREHPEGVIDRLYAGILEIGSQGCAYETGIIVQGPFAGRVVAYDLEGFTRPEFAPETNFLDWYERWLDDVIQRAGAGHAQRPAWHP